MTEPASPAAPPAAPPASLTAAAAAAAAASSARRLADASMTSCLRIRPPTPVPTTDSSETECSAASLRTSGVTYGESPVGSGVGSGYASASAASGSGADWA